LFLHKCAITAFSVQAPIFKRV